MANKPYSIVITNTAEADLDDIYSYIADTLHATQSADELMAKIQERIMQLKIFPLSCPLVPQILPHKEYRKLVVSNYLAFYRVDESIETVYVARVLYGSRNYLTLLADD
jgi:addiction module RelE/StbE family toxin